MTDKEPNHNNLARGLASGHISVTKRVYVEDQALAEFITRLPHTSPVRTAYKFWSGLARDGTIPKRRQIDPVSLGARTIPHVVLIDVEREPRLRFRYRLVGGFVIRTFGENYTGKYIDEMGLGTVFDRIIDFYSQVCDGRLPLLLDGEYERRRGPPFLFRRLAMPLSDGSNGIDSLFCAFDQLNGEEAAIP